MSVQPHRNYAFGLMVVLLLLAGLVGGVVTVLGAPQESAAGFSRVIEGSDSVTGATAASGLFSAVSIPRVLEAVWLSLETGVVEEVLFRGVVLWGLVAWWGRKGERCAVVVSALLFGMLHLIPEGPLVPVSSWEAAGGLAGEEAAGLVLGAQGALKVVQATLFGLLMGRLTVTSPWFAAAGWARARCLAMPVALHVAFDFLYCGIPLLSGIMLPDTYLTGSPGDLVVLLVTIPLLAGAYLLRLRFSWCRAALRRAAGGSC